MSVKSPNINSTPFFIEKSHQMKQKPKFNTPEELEVLANEYFSKYPHVDEAKDPTQKLEAVTNLTNGILPTFSGLVYYIGMNQLSDRQTLSKKHKYKVICGRIMLRLTRFWEAASATGKGQTGVSNWLDTFANFPQKQALSDNRLSCNIVVIGTDGNKQALSDIINATQAQRIQGTRTIEAQAQEVKPQALPKPKAHAHKTTRKAKPRKEKTASK